MENVTVIGKLKVEILEQTESKILAKRLDTISDVYEIFTVSNTGVRSFLKTSKNYEKIVEFYNRL